MIGRFGNEARFHLIEQVVASYSSGTQVLWVISQENVDLQEECTISSMYSNFRIR